jgi:hypothetical protein
VSRQEQVVDVRDAPVASPPAHQGADGAASSHALNVSGYLAQVRATPLAIALTVFGMFLPVVIVPYAFSDDYPLLWMANGGGPSIQFGKNIIETGAVNGRPFAGLLTSWFFSAAGTIDNMRFVRLFAVVAIVALALLLHWALVRSGVKPLLAALIAVLVASMPPFQVWASWTLLFSVPFGALAAGGASRLAVAAVDGPRRLRTDRLVGAAGLLIAALLTYQPAAMFFWVFFAVALIGAADDSPRAKRLVWTHFGLAAVALAVAYVVIKVTVHLLGSSATGAARNTLTNDLGGKVHWFFHTPLYQGLNLFDLTPSRWLAALVAVVAAAGMLLLIRRRCASPLLYIGVGIVLIPLTFLPNLVVAENSPTFRVQVALTSLIALYACLGAIGIWLTARAWLQRRVSGRALTATERVAYAFAVAVVGLSALSATNNVTTLFAEPQMTELRLLRGQVSSLPSDVTRVAFVQTGYTQGLTKLALVGEFGVPTTTQLFNLEPSVLLLLHEEGRLPTNGLRPTVDIYPWTATTLPKNEPVVDLRGMQRLR